MNISSQSFQSLTDELINIKVAVLGILVLQIVIGIIFLLIFVEFCRFVKHTKKQWHPSVFKNRASDLLQKDKIDDLIFLSKDRLSNYPHSELAHWYLGVGYYRKKKWDKALNEFKEVLILNPAWLKNTDPFMKMILKMQEENPQKSD